MSFSGEVTSTAEFGFKRDWFTTGDRKQVSPSAYIVGNFLLDSRFPMGIKAFANTEVQYFADSSRTQFSLQEMFIDANIKHVVYFRTGKQVLQWGRCYFWNPTDLINVERKKFIEDVGYREGAYGIKMHIPYATKFNFISFLDMRNMTSLDSLAGAAKVEFLIGGTEIGAAVWGKKFKDPFFGLDFSSSLFDFGVAGEIGITSGTQLHKNVSQIHHGGYSQIFHPIDEDFIIRACLGVSRIFDFMEIDDRVSVEAEVYFNQAGYTGNVFKKYHIGDYIDAINALPDSLRNKWKVRHPVS